MKSPTAKVIQRPAETAGVAGSLAFLLGRALGWDPTVTNAVAIVAGALPAAVTFLVELVRKKS
jgi:hypothetical protein